MTRASVNIANRELSDDSPTFVVAEIGINHNGSVELAKRLIDIAVNAGCDAVKFQKRNPELVVPPVQRAVMRETPWGLMTYMDYRYRVEFGSDEYAEIDAHCRRQNIPWFMSVWDTDSLSFALQFGPPAIKIPSAQLAHRELICRAFASGIPVILSTGMSDQQDVDEALVGSPVDRTVLCQCVSTYPAQDRDLNLKVIANFRAKYPFVIGYSGHETGLSTTLAAVVLGARFIERHITADRALWGTDHAASLEPEGLRRLVRDIRAIESAMGDGMKRVLPDEIPIRQKLRWTAV